MVLWKGVEPSRENSHKYLKLARLPIPPPEQLPQIFILIIP